MNTYYICNVTVAPLRAEPTDAGEIVSQLLFGDRVILIETNDNWWKIKTKHDNYEGWMDFKQLEKLTEIQFTDDQSFQYITPPVLDNRLIDEQGEIYYLSPSSTLPFYKDEICYIGNKSFKVINGALLPNKLNFATNVTAYARFYLNTPYLWGGRSLFGIDCSGFSQAVYKLFGINLPRDASQQVNEGETVDFLSAAKTGDLAFFDNNEGKITHVGIMLDNDKIIHASGKVRIDPIDDQGIYNNDLEKYTHKLRIIKRFL